MTVGKAQAIVAELLTHTNPQVAKNAARALAILGSREDIHRLVDLAVRNPDTELGKEAFGLIASLPTGEAREAAVYVMTLLRSEQTWFTAYRILASLNSDSWRKTTQRPGLARRLHLGMRASVLFALSAMRGHTGRMIAMSVGGAVGALVLSNFLLLWLWGDLFTADSYFVYMGFAAIPAAVALFASRLLLSPIHQHPFRSVVLGVQAAVIAVATGLLVSVSMLLLWKLNGGQEPIALLIVAFGISSAFSAGGARIAAAIARAAVPRQATPKLTSFVLTAIACFCLFVASLGALESRFGPVTWSGAQLSLEHGMVGIALTILLLLCTSFVFLDTSSLRRLGGMPVARGIVAIVAMTLIAVAWVRGDRSQGYNSVACNWSAPATAARYDYYPQQLPASIGVVVEGGEGKIVAAMPEPARGSADFADYAVTIKTRNNLPRFATLLQYSTPTGDDPPVAEIVATQGEFVVTGGLSDFVTDRNSFSDASTSRVGSAVPAGQRMSRTVGLWTSGAAVREWNFPRVRPMLISVACGQQSWPRAIANDLQTWPVSVGDSVIIDKPDTASIDGAWNSNMDVWVGKPMTAVSLAGSGRHGLLFHVHENALMWNTDWIAHRSAPTSLRTTDLKVITPLGVYQSGVAVIKRGDSDRTEYQILGIRDESHQTSASGYVACIKAALGSKRRALIDAHPPTPTDTFCSQSDSERADLADLTPTRSK